MLSIQAIQKFRNKETTVRNKETNIITQANYILGKKYNSSKNNLTHIQTDVTKM